MSESASRWLFLVEVVILALPGLAIMAIYALTFGGYALVGVAGLSAMVLTGSFPSAGEAWGALGLAALTLAVLAISISGLFAIGTFALLATRFSRKGRSGFETERWRFRRGLAYAVAPLAVMLPFGWLATRGDHPVDMVMGFYASGLVLVPPVLHLWLELRRAQVRT